jgi:hypothetical protein
LGFPDLAAQFIPLPMAPIALVARPEFKSVPHLKDQNIGLTAK